MLLHALLGQDTVDVAHILSSDYIAARLQALALDCGSDVWRLVVGTGAGRQARTQDLARPIVAHARGHEALLLALDDDRGLC